MNTNIEKFKQLIDSSSKIVFFGGAGVSTESNIPDFRSSDGLYASNSTKLKISPEEILSYHFFKDYPSYFYEFYRDKMIYPDAEPNITHKKLVELEKTGKLLGIITQNIDGLHQKAGSTKVAELHGTATKYHCIDCNTEYDLEYILSSKEVVPVCKECGGIVRPNITLYEETLPRKDWNQAYRWVNEADLLIIGGTSLTVYPAADLIYEYQGNSIVVINKELINITHVTENDIVFKCSLGEVFSQL